MNTTIARLLAIGFLTGSRAFGTEKQGSDWDIVYSIQDSDKIEDILEGCPREPSEYNSGYKIKTSDGAEINLIPVHPHEFLPWYLTTKAMAATLKVSGITNPVKKYALFETIKGSFRGLVDQKGTLEAYDRLKDKVLSGEYE